MGFQTLREGELSREQGDGDLLSQLVQSFGKLTLFEDAGNEETPQRVEIDGLHVVRVVKTNAPRTEGWLSFSLADDRIFWSRGFLDRWEFNVLDDAGFEIPSTVHNDIRTVSDLASYICSRLYNSPEVEIVPEEWETQRVSIQFSPFERPKSALLKFLKKYAAVISLHNNRTIGFYPEGVGPVGSSSGGPFGGNDIALSPEFLQFFGGEGDVQTVEFGHVPRRVVVVGGARYQTADVLCEPVVMVRGRPVPMAHGLALLDAMSKEAAKSFGGEVDPLETLVSDTLEAFVAGQDLVGNFFGATREKLIEGIEKITGLKPIERWVELASRRVLKPKAKRDGFTPALDEIDTSAFRLYRVVVSDQQGDLLPINDQADTLFGKRIPPKALAATYKKRTGALRISQSWGSGAKITPSDLPEEAEDFPIGEGPTPGLPGDIQLEIIEARDAFDIFNIDLARAENRLAAIRNEFDTKILLKKAFFISDLKNLDREIQKVEELKESFLGGTDPEVDPRANLKLDSLRERILQSSVLEDTSRPSREAAFMNAVERRTSGLLESVTVRAARMYIALQLLGPALQDRNLDFSVATEIARDGISQLVFEFALVEFGTTQVAGVTQGDILAAYKGARRDRNKLVPWKANSLRLGRLLDEIGEARQKGNDDPAGLLLQAATLMEAVIAEKRKWLEDAKYSPLPTVAFFTNEPLAIVESFSIVDRKQGLIKFREPVGHLDRGDTESLDGRALRAAEVRLVYGVRLRPNPGQRPGDDRYERNPEDEFFWAAFTDTELRGNSEGTVSEEQTLDTVVANSSGVLEVGSALVVYRNDLVELIDAGNRSNRSVLVREAFNEAVRKIQDVETRLSRRTLYLRPWDVNCNGNISGVRIALRQGGMGFETQIFQGLDTSPFLDANKTRERIEGQEQGVERIPRIERTEQ